MTFPKKKIWPTILDLISVLLCVSICVSVIVCVYRCHCTTISNLNETKHQHTHTPVLSTQLTWICVLHSMYIAIVNSKTNIFIFVPCISILLALTHPKRTASRQYHGEKRKIITHLTFIAGLNEYHTTPHYTTTYEYIGRSVHSVFWLELNVKTRILNAETGFKCFFH